MYARILKGAPLGNTNASKHSIKRVASFNHGTTEKVSYQVRRNSDDKLMSEHPKLKDATSMRDLYDAAPAPTETKPENKALVDRFKKYLR